MSGYVLSRGYQCYLVMGIVYICLKLSELEV